MSGQEKQLFTVGAIWRSPRNIYYEVESAGPEVSEIELKRGVTRQVTLVNIEGKRKVRRRANAVSGWTYISPCYSKGIIDEDRRIQKERLESASDSAGTRKGGVSVAKLTERLAAKGFHGGEITLDGESIGRFVCHGDKDRRTVYASRIYRGSVRIQVKAYKKSAMLTKVAKELSAAMKSGAWDSCEKTGTFED